MQNDALVGGPDGLQADDVAVLVLQQVARRGAIEGVDTVRIRPGAERLDHGEAAADRAEAGGRCGDEVEWQWLEAHAEGLEPGDGSRGVVGEVGDQIRSVNPRALEIGERLAKSPPVSETISGSR
ncbi:MAG: hypothetical protein R3D67_06530 [Hyphomicrobiaceae bacterium]